MSVQIYVSMCICEKNSHKNRKTEKEIELRYPNDLWTRNIGLCLFNCIAFPCCHDVSFPLKGLLYFYLNVVKGYGHPYCCKWSIVTLEHLFWQYFKRNIFLTKWPIMSLREWIESISNQNIFVVLQNDMNIYVLRYHYLQRSLEIKVNSIELLKRFLTIR